MIQGYMIRPLSVKYPGKNNTASLAPVPHGSLQVLSVRFDPSTIFVVDFGLNIAVLH